MPEGSYTYSEAFRNLCKERDEAREMLHRALAGGEKLADEVEQWRDLFGRLHALFVLLAELTKEAAE